MSGIGLDQRNLFGLATGELQVIDGLLVDVEHACRGAELRGHVGDGCAISQGERRSAFAEKLQIGRNHLLIAQELGQRQYNVGGGDAGLTLTAQLDADDIRQAHVRGTPQHHVFSLQTTDPDGDDA